MSGPVGGRSSATSSDGRAVVLAQVDCSMADLISSDASGTSIEIVVLPGPVTSVASKNGFAAFTEGILAEAAVTGEVVLGLPRLRRQVPQGYSTPQGYSWRTREMPGC